jgi:hypothetical protein
MVTRNQTAHLESLRILCEQAEKLSKKGDALRKRLEKQLEATRASLHLSSPAAPAPERRRKNRKKS